MRPMRARRLTRWAILLFAVVSLARRLKVNPEDALRVAGRKRSRERFGADRGGPSQGWSDIQRAGL